MFLLKNTIKLLKYIKTNDHVIELEKNKQLSFRSIYNLKPMELKTLKIYIKITLANSFILSFKSFAGTSILFDQKLNKSLYLCIDY